VPGPAPTYRPRFPDDFLAESRRLVSARTAAAHLRQRACLVLLLHEQPAATNTQAGQRIGLHPNSVRLWRKRWAEGRFSLEDEPGRGRKPRFPPS
jgi:hypothetical protein